MFEMLINSIKLFMQGKLFQDFNQAMLRWVAGVVVEVIIVTLLAVFVNVWVGAIVGGLIGGGLMPFLFKDLKYQ